MKEALGRFAGRGLALGNAVKSWTAIAGIGFIVVHTSRSRAIAAARIQ